MSKETNPFHSLFNGSFEILETLNGIKFTTREVDIIACILHIKGTSKIAPFLSISPKTVETHIANIIRKMDCNARERVIDFIERSGKTSLFREYFSELLIQAHFEQQALKKISLLIEKKNTCLLTCWDKPKDKNILISKLEKHLKLLGFNTVTEDHKPSTPDFQHIDLTLCIISEESTKNLHTKNNQTSAQYPGKIIYIVTDQNTSNTPVELANTEYISSEKQENYYFLFFEVLAKLSPLTNLQEIIADFKSQYKAIYNSSNQPFYLKEYPWLDKNILSGTIISILQKGTTKYLLGVCLCFGVLYSLFYSKNISPWPSETSSHKGEEIVSIRMDSPIPMEKILLKRPLLISQIKQKLENQQEIKIVALVGIGGSGKTTLARQFARLAQSLIVWEINAETKNSLITSFTDLAYALAQTTIEKNEIDFIQKIQDHSEKMKRLLFFVRKSLKKNPNWLLIYDNVESFSDIKNYFPNDPQAWGNGQVIITTRDNNIKNNNQINSNYIIYVKELSEGEKFTLFTSILYGIDNKNLNAHEKERIDTFLKEILSFPLDITTAAYYLRDTRISYEKYIKRVIASKSNFDKNQESLLKEAGDYTNTRYGIIVLTLKRLMQENPDFMDLLLLLSLIDSQNISKDFLSHYKKNTVVEQFIHNLRKHSFILGTEDASVFSIHRSIQNISLGYFVRSLNLKEDNQLIQSMASMLETYMIKIAEEENILRMKLLASHCERFLSHRELLTEVTRASISGELGCIYYYLRDYINAESLLEENLARLKKCKDIAPAKIARLLTHLGNVARELGKLNDAKSKLEQSLAIYKNLFSENHIEVARVMAHLGNVYKDLSNFEKAKELLEKSILIYKNLYAEKHAGLAGALTYLGTVYTSMGNYEKAKHLLEESLAIYKKHFSTSYVGLARASAYLGIMYRNLGDYEKAKELIEDGINVYRRHVSKNHMDVAWALAHLGDAYSASGNYEKAKDLIGEAVNIYKEHPENHLSIAQALAHLGNVYNNVEDYNKAKEVLEQSITIYRKKFAEDHGRVVWVSLYLGNAYKGLKDYNKAKELLEGVLRHYEKKFGRKHIETARVLRDLGHVYLLAGKIAPAENLINESLEILQQNKHPESYLALELLAEVYLKKALEEQQKGNIQQSKTFKIKATNAFSSALDIMNSHFPTNASHIQKLQLKLLSADG